ncbi:MAG: VWA domain-containing protein [Blastocatellia bacterium]
MHFRAITIALLIAGLLALPSMRARQQQEPRKPQDPQKKQEPQEETISVETSLVVLNATITDAAGHHVSGLKETDFTIFEDGVPQKIQLFNVDEMPFASAILLDASASMEGKMAFSRAACANFIDGIREGDVYSIYSFSGTKVKLHQDFTEVRDVPDSIWDMRADSKTPLFDAIVKASDALSQREERRRAILLVSDGGDTNSRASLDDAVRKSSGANVTVYAVDLSDANVYKTGLRDLGLEAMKSLTAKTGGRFFKTPGGTALRDAFADTVEELRKQYTLGYDSTNEKQDGKWRVIEVRVSQPGLSIRTRQGYYARKKKG